jgi:hypothetical protein
VTPISLGIFASANQSAAATSFESIATVSVGASSVSSVTFSSIPQTYTHLQIRAIARIDAADTVRSINVQYNSDTGSNYDVHLLYGNGSNALATAQTSQNFMIYQVFSLGANASSNTFAPSIVDILDYTNTNKYKTSRAFAGSEWNTSSTDAQVRFASGLWRSTSAITSITLTPNTSGNIVQYSHFALYGIKSA